MISAESQGNLPGFKGFDYQLRLSSARFRDFIEVLGIGIALRPGFLHRDVDIAAVLNVVTERLELGLKTGNAHGGGSHIHAAARLAEIERHADDADVLGLNILKRFGDGAGGHDVLVG